MIIEYEISQGSPEWFALKLGKPSSSDFSKITTSKGIKSKAFRDYAFEKAAEIVSGKMKDSFTSKVMDNGTEQEPESRDYFELITGIDLSQAGMIFQDEQRNFLCSPDGFNLDEGIGWEAKNPLQHTHAKYLYADKLPTIYKAQVYGSLWVCKEKIDKWYFMSYNPDMPHLLKTASKDDEDYKIYSEALEKYLPEFNKLVTTIVEKIRR